MEDEHHPVNPCPFCGSIKIEITGDEFHRLWFACTICGAAGPKATRSGVAALELWNVRKEAKGE